MPTPFIPTEEQIASIDPSSGPWEVKIAHRLFQYAPLANEDGTPAGFAFARNGDTLEVLHYDDLVRGLRQGAFTDPTAEEPPAFGEGPGDYGARPDLVEYVKEHKVDDVLAYAGSDADMAALLMDAENEARPNNGEPRKGVIAGLQTVMIDNYLDPSTPAVTSEGPVGPIVDPGDEDEDGPADEVATTDEEQRAMSVADWTPALYEVGAVLRARTVNDVGEELGTFTTATRPTDSEVTNLISQAVDEVRAEHGDPDRDDDRDPTQVYGSMKREVILTTAMQIELTYFPEQVSAGRSPYEALRVQRDRQQLIVGKAIQEMASLGEVGEADDARLPVWNFPVQGNGMVGWGTRW